MCDIRLDLSSFTVRFTRLVFAVAIPSVVCLSVYNVRAPYTAIKIFDNVLCHFVFSVQNYTEIVTGEPIRRGLNARGVAKYSDVGHVEGDISETVQDTASDTIND